MTKTSLNFQFKIRRDALLGLGSIYNKIMTNQEATQAQIDKISFVKDKVFHAYYNTNAEDRYAYISHATPSF